MTIFERLATAMINQPINPTTGSKFETEKAYNLYNRWADTLDEEQESAGFEYTEADKIDSLAADLEIRFGLSEAQASKLLENL